MNILKELRAYVVYDQHTWEAFHREHVHNERDTRKWKATSRKIQSYPVLLIVGRGANGTLTMDMTASLDVLAKSLRAVTGIPMTKQKLAELLKLSHRTLPLQKDFTRWEEEEEEGD